MNDIIKIAYGETQMVLENEVMKAVCRVGISVNKEELVKALELSESLVRCKECKRRKNNKFCLEHGRYEKNDDGFCSYGERMVEPQMKTHDKHTGTHECVKVEPQTERSIGCSKCGSRWWCYDRDQPHAIHCNNYGKVTDKPQPKAEISIDKEKTLCIKMDTLEGYDRVITERGEFCRIFYEDCGECAHNTDRRIELPEYEPFSDALDSMDCQSR